MLRQSDFIPISEMEGYTDEHLTWRVPLPDYVPTESIGLNVDRLKWLAHLGGLRHLRIESQDGDQTVYQAEVNKVDADGSTTVGMKTVKQESHLSSTHLSRELNWTSIGYSEYRWGDGSVTINATELGARVLDKTRQGTSLRDPKIWSGLLDKIIRLGVSKVASEQLMGDVSGPSQLFLGFAALETGILNNLQINSDLILNGFLSSLITQGTMILFQATRGGATIRDRRLSLIPAYQLDRLAAVKGLTKVLKIVKATK